jgi:hypothetical protein
MTGKTICICSNSRVPLLALISHTVSSRLVLQCQNSLQELDEGMAAGSFVQFAEKSLRFETRV